MHVLGRILRSHSVHERAFTIISISRHINFVFTMDIRIALVCIKVSKQFLEYKGIGKPEVSSYTTRDTTVTPVVSIHKVITMCILHKFIWLCLYL